MRMITEEAAKEEPENAMQIYDVAELVAEKIHK